MILGINNSKESTKKTPLRTNEQIQAKLQNTRSTLHISFISKYTSSEQSEKEIKKAIPFIIASKKNTRE